MAYDGSLLNYDVIQFNVSDEGKTVIQKNGRYIAKVATSWKDIKAFEILLMKRLLSH